jgi:hypothetical protein
MQVARCYPDATADFAPGLATLLTTHGRVMDPPTRASLAKALILLRNRGSLDPAAALPLWLALLALPDKALRGLISTHIIADVKRRNVKGRDERLNRAAQGALRGALDGRGAGGRGADAAEPRAARCALGVLTDLWRRRVWRDARTANAIGKSGERERDGERRGGVGLFFHPSFFPPSPLNPPFPSPIHPSRRRPAPGRVHCAGRPQVLSRRGRGGGGGRVGLGRRRPTPARPGRGRAYCAVRAGRASHD